MTTGFPRSPRVHKGAIIGMDPINPLASVVVFQYNPEELSRTVTARASGEGADQGEALRLTGPPQEQITATIELDAVDQLERGDGLAGSVGLHPGLASLEMLLYPKTAAVVANEVLKAVGVVEVIPPEAPLTLFVWGIQRVLPVRITTLTVTEQHFDPELNPLVATVALTMDVLTYHDLGLLSIGGALSMANQVMKEVMATTAGVSAVARAASGSVDLAIGG